MSNTQNFRDPDIHRHGDLEIEDDPIAQARLWKIQKWGRATAIVFLFLALLGAFGRGPLSQAHETSEGLEVHYQRMGYEKTDQDLHIKISRAVPHEGFIRFWIAQKDLSRIQSLHFTPEPSESRLQSDRTIFLFQMPPGEKEAEIKMRFQSESKGLNALHIGLEGGPSLELTQFFWP